MIEIVEDITTPIYKESTIDAQFSNDTKADFNKLENLQSDGNRNN